MNNVEKLSKKGGVLLISAVFISFVYASQTGFALLLRDCQVSGSQCSKPGESCGTISTNGLTKVNTCVGGRTPGVRYCVVWANDPEINCSYICEYPDGSSESLIIPVKKEAVTNNDFNQEDVIEWHDFLTQE